MTFFRYMLAGLMLALCFVGGAPLSFAQTAAHARPVDQKQSVLDDAIVRFQAKRGLDLLYDMRFDEAERLFTQIDQRFPEHPIGPFLKALNTWWMILLDFSDESHDAAFYAAMDEVIARADRMLAKNDGDFDALFFKGAALGFRGRLRSNRRDYLKAATDGKRAMDYVLAVSDRAPSNIDYLFGKGIYDYYAAVIPDRYPVAKPFMAFFPKGNRDRGLMELEQVANEGYYIKTESAYFLLQIHYLFEQDYDKSVYYATWLRDRHPDNSYFHAFEGRVYARWNRWDRAEIIFNDIIGRFKEGKPGYNAAVAEQALYYLARARMNNGAHQQALDYLVQLEALAARSPEDTYFKVMGRLRQGMAYDAIGNRKLAKQRYREVLAMEDWAGAHERAERFLNRSFDGE